MTEFLLNTYDKLGWMIAVRTISVWNQTGREREHGCAKHVPMCLDSFPIGGFPNAPLAERWPAWFSRMNLPRVVDDRRRITPANNLDEMLTKQSPCDFPKKACKSIQSPIHQCPWVYIPFHRLILGVLLTPMLPILHRRWREKRTGYMVKKPYGFSWSQAPWWSIFWMKGWHLYASVHLYDRQGFRWSLNCPKLS